MLCSHFSEDSNAKVINAMRTLSKVRNQKPFECLCDALVHGDIETKVAVLALVNKMLSKVGDIEEHKRLQNDLHEQKFGHLLSETMKTVHKEVVVIENKTKNIKSKSVDLN